MHCFSTRYNLQSFGACWLQGAEEREGSVSFAMQTDNPGVRSDGEEPGAKRRKQPLRMGRPAARALREPSPSLTTGFNSLSSGRADGAASASRMRSSNSGAEQVADRAVLQQRLARPLALLLQAGWQSHTLDSMFLRAAGLAAKQLDSLQQQEASLAVEASWLAGHSAQHAARVAAAAERAGAAARQLEAARQAALQAYYKPQGSAAADSVDGARGVGGSGASAASWSAHLSAALRRSLQKHPPPARCDELAAAAPAPSPGVQFAPLSSARVPGLGLQRKSDAAGLSSSTCSQLGKLPARPALPDVSNTGGDRRALSSQSNSTDSPCLPALLLICDLLSTHTPESARPALPGGRRMLGCCSVAGCTAACCVKSSGGCTPSGG